MIYIKNRRIQDYLYEKGVQPEYTYCDGLSKYITTDNLLSLLDSYTVEHICIPNRLEVG